MVGETKRWRKSLLKSQMLEPSQGRHAAHLESPFLGVLPGDLFGMTAWLSHDEPKLYSWRKAPSLRCSPLRLGFSCSSWPSLNWLRTVKFLKRICLFFKRRDYFKALLVLFDCFLQFTPEKEFPRKKNFKCWKALQGDYEILIDKILKNETVSKTFGLIR